jgi:RNA polymerase sigma factor (sigma-70 family)
VVHGLRWDGEISDVGAYLTSAVINTLRQATRRAMVRERYATIAGRLDGMDVGDESVVDRVRLRAVFRELTEEHREVIVLRYYADLSEAAIADALGVPGRHGQVPHVPRARAASGHARGR